MLAACPDPRCDASFDVADEQAWRRVACPRCGALGPAIAAEARRRLAARNIGADLPAIDDDTLVAVLEDLRSVHNVGSIMRSCDALGAATIIMAGITPTPAHPRLAKTALGAEHTVRWVWRHDAIAAVDELRALGVGIVALENTPTATALAGARIDLPAAIVIGNEVAGVSSPVLERADRHLHIPMRGLKTSLNVAVAFGIAAFTIRADPHRHHDRGT